MTPQQPVRWHGANAGIDGGGLVANRPPFREAVAVDLSRLTPELRRAWDELYPHLRESGCQATLFELWEFDRLCELDLGEFPNWPAGLVAA